MLVAISKFTTMELISLPEELFIMIIKKLDLKSLYNMYNSCQYARHIIRTYTIVRNWYATMNTMATAKYLKNRFFKDIACHLFEMNLCSVPDLFKTTLILALRHAKNLKSLDISYTAIDIVDFYDVYNACPTIKNICLNFTFDKLFVQREKQLIDKYQRIFQNMENVHFIGTTSSLIYSNLVIHFLGISKLNILKLTIVHQKIPFSVMLNQQYNSIVQFNEFHVYFMNLEANYGHYNGMRIFEDIKVDEFDKIIIVNGSMLSDITVYSTPLFKEFFHEKFGIICKNIVDFDNDLTGNIGILIFNNQKVIFDNNFYMRLYKKVKNYLPYTFEYNRQTPLTNNYDWYFTSPVVTQTENTDLNDKKTQDGVVLKKRRVGNPNYVLNYDAVFKEKDKVNLSLSFVVNYVNPVSLSSGSEFLSNLTFLSLSGTVRYSVEFFNVLFRCCKNLVTLDVVAPSISPCVAPVSRSVPLSKTLKNLRLIDRRFDYRTFFLSLSQCKTLENIQIVDQSSEYTSLADPGTLFANCENLYNVCIKACMTESSTKEMIHVFNKSKVTHNRPQIKVSLCQILLTNDRYGLNFEPAMEVFKVFPIKPGSPFSC